MRRLALRTKVRLKGSIDRYLRHVRTLIHLGAHHGQERFLYDAHGITVTWVEANLSALARLEANLAGLPRQRAVAALVADKDGVTHRFRVADGPGTASSMLEPLRHRELFPETGYPAELSLESVTLPTLFAKESITLAPPAALVMDIQGAELLALRSAGALLDRFTYLKPEAADIETYVGGCQLDELDAFLRERGFKLVDRQNLRRLPSGAGLCDLLYRRN